MSEPIWCPACGGPGTATLDWRGDEIVACDAYARCPESVQALAREALAEGFPPAFVRSSALREMAGMGVDLRMLTALPLLDGAV